MSKTHPNHKKTAQLELRRLMSMQKLKKSVEAPKKIESPLASYTAAGALRCNVCRVEVGSEGLWPRHVASREHVREVDSRKGNKRRRERVDMADVEEFREKVAAMLVPPPPKKLRGILKNAEPPSPPPLTPRGSLREAIPPPLAPQAQDDGVRLASRGDGAGSVQGGEAPLPEGFFDDPEQDARARNTEYRNPAEEEWAKFRREMKDESELSARIIADDQDAATAERQIDEIDEQLRKWGRVVELERRVEAARGRGRSGEDGGSSPDEMDFDEFPDWRRKKAYTH